MVKIERFIENNLAGVIIGAVIILSIGRASSFIIYEVGMAFAPIPTYPAEVLSEMIGTVTLIVAIVYGFWFVMNAGHQQNSLDAK